MALEQHKKTIMEHEYTTVFITGSKGLKLLGKLMGYIGKASASLKNISPEDLSGLIALEDEAAIRAIVPVLQTLPEIMDDNFLPFTLEIFQHTMRDGRPIGTSAVFDDVFAGNYTELFYALGWVIYVNYCEDLKDVFMKALDQVKEMNLPEKLKTLLNESQKD